jgi:glutamate dehydrogenase (NAD(P)+)
MDSPFDLCDGLGPFEIVHISRPALGLRAIVVIDNVACGPSIGGVRMAPDVSLEECARLARAMTLKNAAAGLPHGGGKSVIFADPAMPEARKQEVMRAFAQAIGELSAYIPGPDMGTNETAMAWVHDEIGRAVGLPREIGGIPLDEIGATGLGVAVAAEVAEDFCAVKVAGGRVAVQGFGAVGLHAARRLAERGAVLVAAADSHGTAFNPKGIDVEALVLTKRRTGKVTDHPGVRKLAPEAIVGIDCDIWIPAARPDVLTAANVGDLKAKLVVQGANIPATPEAEAMMHEKGILSIPDFIANAGGVICASVEYHGGSEAAALQQIAEKIAVNTRAVLEEARRRKVLPRQAAVALAEARVRRAMALTRWR